MRITCHSCTVEMEQVRRGPARLWRCVSCGAHSLTIPTLRRLMPQEVWSAVWPTIQAAAEPSARLCPSCEERMEQTRELDWLGGMQLDICDPCRLL